LKPYCIADADCFCQAPIILQGPFPFTTEGSLNNNLPIELVNKVWKELTIEDLLVYAITSKVNYNNVHNGVRDSVLRVVGRFCCDAVGVMDLLRVEHAVISGSVALHVMLAVGIGGHGNNAYGWSPNDIDIYVPACGPDGGCQMPKVADYMMDKEGYKFIWYLPTSVDNYLMNPAIRKVIQLEKEGRRMDIIVSSSCLAAAPVFFVPLHSCVQFHNGKWTVFGLSAADVCRSRDH
jgi:hypothetical protein